MYIYIYIYIYNNNYSGQERMLMLFIREVVPEGYQVAPESLKPSLKPSYASSKVKNENDAIRNRISDFDKRRISQPKTQ